MARLSREQLQNVARLKRAAQRHGATRKQTKALLEAAAVESNYRHLNYGDRDSKGILQQRPSQGWGPASESVEKDAAQFLSKAKAVKDAGSAGGLAQAVQRSAFPERYNQRSAEVEKLLANTPTATLAGGPGARTTTKKIPGVDNSQTRALLLQSYFKNRGKPGALTDLVSSVKAAQDVAPKTVTTKTPAPTASAASADDKDTGEDIAGIGKIAQSMGLKVGENPAFGKVYPVHAGQSAKYGDTSGSGPPSWHYQGRAIDVSGDSDKLKKFNELVARRYGKRVKELFYDPGISLDSGKKISPIGGHSDHVHVAM